MPKNDGRPSAANKFARHWCIANEGPPRRKGPRERMAYKRFLGSIFEVELRLVTEGARGQKLAPENQYLVVHNIVSLVARGEKSR
jgi:limonene-1,2-epoxide hydrolase